MCCCRDNRYARHSSRSCSKPVLTWVLDARKRVIITLHSLNWRTTDYRQFERLTTGAKIYQNSYKTEATYCKFTK